MNKKAMQYLLSAAGVMLMSWCLGQQTPSYSQQVVNPFLVNPASAGEYGTMRAFLNVRNQWVQIPGSPLTQTLTLDAPLPKERLAVGLKVVNDKIHFLGTTNIKASVGYVLQIKEFQTLRFGMGIGVAQSRILKDDFIAESPEEIQAIVGNTSSLIPGADVGVRYLHKNWAFGLSALNLLAGRGVFASDVGGDELAVLQVSEFLFQGSKLVELPKGNALEPLVMVKTAEGLGVSVEGGLSFYYHNMVQIFAGTRNANNLIATLGVWANDAYYVGYTFELGGISNNKTPWNTHEVMIGFRLASALKSKIKGFKDVKLFKSGSRKEDKELERLMKENDELKEKEK